MGAPGKARPMRHPLRRTIDPSIKRRASNGCQALAETLTGDRALSPGAEPTDRSDLNRLQGRRRPGRLVRYVALWKRSAGQEGLPEQLQVGAGIAGTAMP